EELIHRDGYDGAQAQHKFEDVGLDSSENGHSLQEFDPRLLHGGTPGVAVIMILGRSVRKERGADRDRGSDLRKGPRCHRTNLTGLARAPQRPSFRITL